MVTRMYDIAMQESGVRSTQFALLVGIAKLQPVTMGALAKVLMLDRSTLTRSLRLLEKARMVDISKRATMRQRFLKLTNSGEKALQQSLPLWRSGACTICRRSRRRVLAKVEERTGSHREVRDYGRALIRRFGC